jgi:hypothetical protein
MDVEQFMQVTPPARRPSRLAPHRAAIEKLRAAGYTLEQVCAYLHQVGVTVSFQAVSKFLLAGAKPAPARSAPVRPQTASQGLADEKKPVALHTGSQPVKLKKSLDDFLQENPNMSRQEAEEKYVDQFSAPPENPLLKRYGAPPKG